MITIPSTLVLNYIKTHLKYDPVSGTVFSKTGRPYCSKRRISRNLYISIRFELDIRYQGCKLVYQTSGHQIAWFLYHGVWPRKFIDHVDGNGLNNAITNLRLATHRQNMRNQRKRLSCSSHYKGVQKRGNKFRAYITTPEGVWVSLGTYSTEEDAARAYNQKAQELFGEFAKLNELTTCTRF